MINVDWSIVRRELEKTAWVWPTVITAGTVLGMTSDYTANRSAAKLETMATPQSADKYAVQPPEAYQFGGSKSLPTRPMIGPMA